MLGKNKYIEHVRKQVNNFHVFVSEFIYSGYVNVRSNLKTPIKIDPKSDTRM